MPVPTSINDLSTTASLNSPAGSESPAILDDIQRAHASFIASLRDASTALTGSVGGQCVLTKSGANLVLSPKNGNKIVINGVMQTVPAAGVSLAPTGLTVSTLYYVYAYMNAGTMTLEASTTGHSTDAATGVEIKAGDATRSLVGMVQPITGPAFADTVTQRFVRSWFNDRGVSLVGTQVSITSASNVFLEFSASARAEFLSWAGEAVSANTSAFGYTASTNNSAYSGIGLDGATTSAGDAAAADIANSFTGMSSAAIFHPDEGFHFVTPTWRSSGGFNATVLSAVRGTVGR